MSRDQVHLRPTAPLAERVLLPGDPGRALALAQSLLTEPRMFNHHRGLWGYTGIAADGEQLTIQSTGMGGPSAAIVLHELILLGACSAIRVGTCGALRGDLELGDLLIAHEALVADGASRALGAGERVSADPALTAALRDAGAKIAGSQPPRKIHAEATVVSTDLFYEPDPTRARQWRAEGAIAVEMEAATLFTIGALQGVSTACLLIVSDILDENHEPERIDDTALLSAAEAMGALAVEGLRA